MATVWNVTRYTTCMNIFQTDWTICMRNIFYALQILSNVFNTLYTTNTLYRYVIQQFHWQLTELYSMLHTVCPFCNWTGKHILHLAQWKNRSRPPTLHIPQPSQWYWFLSSSSNKLHSRHVYLPNRQWQFWQVACTGWRVSHKTHISSVTSFLFTVCVSSLSWQNRHVYTLLQHGV